MPRTERRRAPALVARLSAGLGAALFRGRRLLVALMVGAAVAFVVSLGITGSGNGYSLFALITLIWLSFLLAYAHLAARGVPVAPPAGSGMLVRIGWRVRQLVAWCLIVLMASLAGVLVVFTLRVLTVIGE